MIGRTQHGLLQPKLIDFGLSICLCPGEKTKDICGTLAYCSPEIVKKEPYDSKTDVWSLGIVAYSVLRGKLPFVTESKKETIENIISLEIQFSNEKWRHISPLAKDLITAVLEKDPRKRLKVDHILEHPWFERSKSE
jgi:serine/threonine protein kinase